MFSCRKRWKDEVFGFNEGDDVDCLFFILARSMTDQQKGTSIYQSIIFNVTCIKATSLNRLMRQSIIRKG